ncbi:hypothetical protein OAN61_00080 [bacterium]|nr:hypothetical protein [bacterium]
MDDKIHARARGTNNGLTRQPLEGRGRDGGCVCVPQYACLIVSLASASHIIWFVFCSGRLRFGEMERDCMISHGAAHFMRDRLFINSDCYRIHVCNACGMMAVAELAKKEFRCTHCMEGSYEIYQVRCYVATVSF